MAKYYSSTFGKISGKHGTAVAVLMKDGSTYLRKYTKPSNPRTDKQQAHRAKFALSSKALVPFNPIFKETMGITNGISQARSHAFKNAIVGEYPRFSMNYEELMFSFGSLEKLAYASYSINEDVINLNWDYSKMYNSHKNDSVCIVVFNKETNQSFHLKDVAVRSQKNCKIDIDESWAESELYLWAYVTSGDKISDSVFVSNSISADVCVSTEDNKQLDSPMHSGINQVLMAFILMIYSLLGLFSQVSSSEVGSSINLLADNHTTIQNEGAACANTHIVNHAIIGSYGAT